LNLEVSEEIYLLSAMYGYKTMIVIKGIDQSKEVRYYSHYNHKMEDLVRAYPDIEHARVYTLRYLDLRMCLLDAGSHDAVFFSLFDSQHICKLLQYRANPEK
jgi:hypothetical protein